MAFLTFSANPKFQTATGTLSQRLRAMNTDDWEMNTNLHAAFAKILEVAVKHKALQEDMPSILLILSDMQFDSCVEHDDSAIEMIERKYKDAGYNVPNVIFWNLNAAYKNEPVQFDKRGTALVSGFSPAIMKAVLANDLEEFTPMNVMLKTLMDDRYNYA